MPTMQWSDNLANNLAPMDQTHREFIDLYNCLAAAAPEAMLPAMDAFIEHTDAHFAQENRWMEAVGFPGCHKAEHDRVMVVLRDVRRRAAEGDAFLARRLVEELPAWFENHVNGMDAALAFHLDSVGFDVNTGVAAKQNCEAADGACSCTGAAAAA